jgi:hypothetical protein
MSFHTAILGLQSRAYEQKITDLQAPKTVEDLNVGAPTASDKQL